LLQELRTRRKTVSAFSINIVLIVHFIVIDAPGEEGAAEDAEREGSEGEGDGGDEDGGGEKTQYVKVDLQPRPYVSPYDTEERVSSLIIKNTR
jgi:hypothetical protein